jgi:hypothetical protein
MARAPKLVEIEVRRFQVSDRDSSQVGNRWSTVTNHSSTVVPSRWHAPLLGIRDVGKRLSVSGCAAGP